MSRKRNNALLLATIATGAYFSKKENREKAQEAFTNMKTKVESYMDDRKKDASSKESMGAPTEIQSYDLSENEMVSEGAQTTVNYYNQEMQDSPGDDKDGLYKSEEK